MDNQHQKIAGYRDLLQAEVDLMNEIKALEERVAEVYRRVAYGRSIDDEFSGDANRWAGIGKTHLETGFMFLLKAVARPTNGLGRA